MTVEYVYTSGSFSTFAGLPSNPFTTADRVTGNIVFNFSEPLSPNTVISAADALSSLVGYSFTDGVGDTISSSDNSVTSISVGPILTYSDGSFSANFDVQENVSGTGHLDFQLVGAGSGIGLNGAGVALTVGARVDAGSTPFGNWTLASTSQSAPVTSTPTTHTDNGTSAALTGGNGNDVFVGTTGNDTITTGTGDNLIAPGSGNDVMYLHGQDTVFPGSGSDTIFAFGPALVAMGQETLFFINGSNPSTVLGGSGGPLIAAAGAGGGLYKGSSAGGNVLIGGSGTAVLFGAGNNDLLFAGSGGGTLIAGPGNETLSGVAATANILYFAGTGNDLMGGGSGANIYSFVNGNAGGADEIIGFNPSKGDYVALWNYGYAAFQTALANQVDSGSGATITLSDNTSITFAGVTNLSSTSFIVT